MSLSRFLDVGERMDRLALFRVRRLRDRSNPLEDLSDDQFQKRFRLSKDATIYVVQLIEGSLSNPLKRGTQLPPVLQFLVALRFFATGSFQIVVGDLNNLSQGTISKIVKKVSSAIARLRVQFIRYPTEEEAPLVRQNFFQLGGFPGVVGAIDCTHVVINSPGGENAELFRNRKGVFSINVQAICTSELKITNVVARWYGSAHDNRIFDNSKICGKLETARAPGILVGDGGYGCTPFLMTPVEGPRTLAEQRYNRAQIQTRNPIERCFGVLKQRFHCLRHMRLKLGTTLTVIVSCCILHNIALLFGDNLELQPEVEEEQNAELIPPTTSGIAARNRIIISHFS